MTTTPRDFHNELAEESISRRAPVVMRESELELAAFERGRQQGDLEAIRRLEAEGQLGPKTMINNTTNIVNTTVATANVVEIEHLTHWQKAAAVIGEASSIAYIVIMAYWIDMYRGGVGWDNGDAQNNRGMFNVHVIASFVGLFAACQAYLLYRVLPLRTPTMINKINYFFWQALALTSFAITIAAAIKTQPGVTMQSMHAWTSMLAVLVYAVHAIYSTIRVLFSHRHAVSAHRWNETINIAEQPTVGHNWHMSAEQRRDHNNQLPTLYRAAPILSKEGHAAHTEYNADGTVNAGAGSAPRWSESTESTATSFFLVPRAKWAVASLIGLGVSVLIGLGEWQMILATGRDQWSQQGNPNGEGGELDFTSTEARLIGVIGLTTLLGLMAIAYAAMPPRTVVAKGAFAAVPIVLPAAGTRHGSVSIAGNNDSLAPQPIEVV